MICVTINSSNGGISACLSVVEFPRHMTVNHAKHETEILLILAVVQATPHVCVSC